MLHSHYEVLLLFLLYAALKDILERRIPKQFFLFFFLCFFCLLQSDSSKHSILLFPILLFLILLLSYPLFYFTGSGGGDWKLFSLLLSLLPINLSIPLLFLTCIFSLLLFYLLKEDIPFALALFLAAVPLLS
ncbi:prepilin peptidase [Oribacterium asaccharolyticum]|uniref:prepilin peptidase n=1 Tax=Oribacterium asaccharolyticum TaxID=1501332 RepID=UPI0028E9EE2F|nr:prepilin peptidase [Oribacterium asaccharolyticum]